MKSQSVKTLLVTSGVLLPLLPIGIFQSAHAEGAYGPDTCIQGYVWREAFSGDHVCVTPQTRAQAADDNAQAENRKQRGGGAYGPDTCRQGYVWREASPTDHVCVTPQTRTQAAFDNSQAVARKQSSATTVGFGDDNHGCAVDRPCFNGAYQSGDKVIFQFTGITGWDFYNVRYAKVGGGETQVENHSGSFTFNNTQPNRVYTLKVQGCNSHFLAPSTCSAWVEESVTTK